MAVAAEWRRRGMFKGIGLPTPSGQHRVGCVDVMPLCPGEESGLLFRLYYPTEATPDSGYQYPPWLPNKLYAKGYLLFKRYSSLVAGALGTLINNFCGKSWCDQHHRYLCQHANPAGFSFSPSKSGGG